MILDHSAGTYFSLFTNMLTISHRPITFMNIGVCHIFRYLMTNLSFVFKLTIIFIHEVLSTLPHASSFFLRYSNPEIVQVACKFVISWSLSHTLTTPSPAQLQIQT